MFFPGSRYQKQPTYTITLADGTVVSAVKPPLPAAAPAIGFHRSKQGERLDLIANHYLGDATTFWRLCDANNSVVPDALATRALVGIPKKRA
jgi:nucleoid-associated protein YgaU